MTYQATATEVHDRGTFTGVVDNIRGFFQSFGQALVASSSGHRRLREVQALQAKSDQELAELKIKREDIVHHVFRDLYYI